MTEAPIVSVAQGRLQGRNATTPNGKSFFSFQGIPYAKPPVGPLRFKAPQPPEPWTGVLAATSEGNRSPQINFFGSKGYEGDENCLFLNIYTPNLFSANLPVMVFVHGGGFTNGSGNTDLYGPDYLVEKDVVTVTLNYRCGVLGFLSLNTPEVPGNAGLKDVVEAIRWVKTNIQNFGGNASNITVFGESAGGAAVSFLTVSPLTKNLINKAIIQSGTALSTFTLQKNSLENARELAKVLGRELRDPQEILEFLGTCSAKEIVEAHLVMNPPEKFLEKLNVFSVVIEKEFPGVEALITESFSDLLTSGRVANIPIMIGACSLEFGVNQKIEDLQILIPEELNIKRNSAESLEIVKKLKELYLKDDELDGLSQLISDRFIKVDTNRNVQYLVQVTNRPIYYYNFDYVGALNIYSKLFHVNLKRAGHMDDLGYLFRNDFQTDLKLSEQDKKMRERMVGLWTNFAKFGNPTPDDKLSVTWLPVTTDNVYHLNIGSELTLQSDIDKEKMEFWDNLYRKYYRIWEQPKTNIDELPIKYDPPIVVNGIKATPAPSVTKVGNISVRPATAVAQVQPNQVTQVVIRANDPPEDDLPKNIGVNKFVNFFDSLGGKK